MKQPMGSSCRLLDSEAVVVAQDHSIAVAALGTDSIGTLRRHCDDGTATTRATN